MSFLWLPNKAQRLECNFFLPPRSSLQITILSPEEDFRLFRGARPTIDKVAAFYNLTNVNTGPLLSRRSVLQIIHSKEGLFILKNIAKTPSRARYIVNRTLRALDEGFPAVIPLGRNGKPSTKFSECCYVENGEFYILMEWETGKTVDLT